MAFTLQQLHDEIENDPNTIGYKEGAAWKSDGVIAALINDTANGGTIQRQYVSPGEIIEQIALADWNTAEAAERLYLQLLPSLESISTVQNGTEVRNNLISIFDQGSTTRTNLLAIIQRTGSRAEVLWGENVLVTAGDVGRASNL